MQASQVLRRLAVTALLLGLNGILSHAQTTEDGIRARLVGQPLLLRGFWLDDNLHFDSAGNALAGYKTGPFTECAFDAETVKLDGKQLIIQGQRVGIFFDGDTPERMPLRKEKGFKKAPEEVTVRIDGQGNTDFGDALDRIFAPSLTSLVPAMPDSWQYFARKHLLESPASDTPSTPTSHSTPTPDCSDEGTYIKDGVTRPAVLKQYEPHFSEPAWLLKFSGKVEVSLWLLPDGTPTHLSIVRAAGMGLDEEALLAISRYRFKPAMKEGKAVPVDLCVIANFQILR